MNQDIASSPSEYAPASPTPCGICGEPVDGRKNHIFSDFEQKRLKDGEEKYVVVDPSGRRVASPEQGGFWQRGLLCKGCETRCGDLERYWANLASVRQFESIQDSRVGPWTIPNVDTAKVATLLISVLLRAHAATTSGFEKFSLGPFFADAVSAFQTGDPFAIGFRMRAWLPQSTAYTKEISWLPSVDLSLPAFVVWFGVFRFAIGPPKSPWSQNLMELSSHPVTGGMVVTTIELEQLPEYQGLVRAAPRIDKEDLMKRRRPKRSR